MNFEIFSKLYAAISTIPWKDVASALRKLLAKQKWVIILSSTCLILATFCATVYWRRSSQLEGIVSDTLQASLEETPQQHKGLEAFLMTSLNEQVSGQTSKPLADYVRLAELSSGFVDRFNEFVDKLNSKAVRNCALPDQPLPKLKPVQGFGSEIIVSDQSLGFLFAPLRLFRPLFTDDDLFNLTQNEERIQPILEDVLKHDPLLARDICVSAQLARETHQFSGTSVLDKLSLENGAEYLDIKPRQTYLISRNGLNRIFLRSTKGTDKYYASQFRSTTFFPSRPYFWPAFDSDFVFTNHTKHLAFTPRTSSFFHVTQPYMDLGGNGVVITLSKGFRVPDVTEFALCFDLAFEADAGIQTSLRRTVERFDGYLTEVTCKIHDNSSACYSNHPGRPENGDDVELREALTKELRDSVKDGQQDRVFGNILVLPPLRASLRRDVVLASIPVGKVSIDGADKSADFLIVQFDFFKYRRVTTSWGVTAISLIFLAVSVLGFFVTRSIMQSREFEVALNRLTFIMADSAAPFVWLDRDDHVSYANDAFWRLMGRAPTREFTLRSAITPESLSTYDRVQEQRKTGAHVDPYDISIVREDGSTRPVRVRSMDVPSLRSEQGLPETFGSLLDLSRE